MQDDNIMDFHNPQVPKKPIGIMPERIWKLKRIDDLKAAIYRYLEANESPLVEWYIELDKLIRELRINNGTQDNT